MRPLRDPVAIAACAGDTRAISVTLVDASVWREQRALADVVHDIGSVADALVKLGDRATRFERAYRTMIDRVRRLGLSTTVCTIYNGNLSEDEAAVARLGLTAFNDVILRVAFESRFRVIDLRLVCSEPSDYANPIEPSSAGGEKIARAILASLGLTEPPIERSEVFF